VDETAVTVILSLVGFLQTVFMFIIGYIFKVQNTLFTKLDRNKKECRDLIDRILIQDKADKVALEKKLIDLLDKHYVTTGDLNTLEQELKGDIKGLTIAINNLTSTIESKLQQLLK